MIITTSPFATRWFLIHNTQPGVDDWAHFDDLVSRYREPHRVYHTLDHLAHCFRVLDAFYASRPSIAFHSGYVEYALWYHDAVYVPGATDNEWKSAELLRQHGGLRFDGEESVADLILATQSHMPVTQPNAQIVCDVDCAILGAEPNDYEQYLYQVTREYCANGLHPSRFMEARRERFLVPLLKRGSIYQADYFRGEYEAQARKNMLAEATRVAFADPVIHRIIRENEEARRPAKRDQWLDDACADWEPMGLFFRN